MQRLRHVSRAVRLSGSWGRCNIRVRYWVVVIDMLAIAALVRGPNIRWRAIRALLGI